MTIKLSLTIQELTETNLVKAGISLRSGGVSNIPYSSLNLATHVGDTPEAVAQNRLRFSKGTGITSLKYCQQIHSDRVINGKTLPKTLFDKMDQNLNTVSGDALITAEYGDTLGVFTADCVPIFILDTVTPAVAIVHAGWRGTIALIVTKVLTQMINCYGTHAENCLIHLGPSIQKCCYQVSSELLIRFEEHFGESVHNGHSLSLHTANVIQLADVGVPVEFISTSPFCTACRTDMFYSYRAEGGQTGRMLSYIQLT